MNCKVTIIAPVYNGEKYICNFVESIINQDYENWELIIVDDGSTDSTFELVKNYSIKDSRVVCIKRDNTLPKGANTCRNIGIKKITGKYFIILDSDDVVENVCLKQRVNFMENNQNLDFGIFPGKSLVINNKGEMIKGKKLWGRKVKGSPIIPLLKADYNFGVWNIICKTETMSSVLWDEKLKIYMDFDYLFRIFMLNKLFDYAQDAVEDYGYIQGRSNAITSSFVSDEKYSSTIYLFNKTISELRKHKKIKYIKYYYFFFLSFYQKVIHSDNIKMYTDFFDFFINTYKNQNNFRLKLLDKYCRKKIENKIAIGKKVDYLIVFLFYPQKIIPKLFNYVIKKIYHEK